MSSGLNLTKPKNLRGKHEKHLTYFSLSSKVQIPQAVGRPNTSAGAIMKTDGEELKLTAAQKQRLIELRRVAKTRGKIKSIRLVKKNRLVKITFHNGKVIYKVTTRFL